MLDVRKCKIAVEHAGRYATLMSPRLAVRSDLRLGVSRDGSKAAESTDAKSSRLPPLSIADASTSAWNHGSGSGLTYHFGDPAGDNLALTSRACQSSTKFAAVAKRAIDGKFDPHFSQGSVSHTSSGIDDPTPWWQLSLARPAVVGTIRIWAREPEVAVAEVRIVCIHHRVASN